MFTVTGPVYAYNNRAVKDTIQYGSRRDRVTQKLRPVNLFYVRSKDQRLFIPVSLVNDLKEQVRLFCNLQLKSIVPHFIYDQNIAPDVFFHPGLEGFLKDSRVKVCDQIAARGVQYTVISLTRNQGKAAGKVALARARSADKQDGFTDKKQNTHHPWCAGDD